MITNNKNELKKIITSLKKSGKIIIIKSGIFDIIHPGHINHIKSLKKYGDIVIILVRSDKYAKKRKGKKRPINPQKERVKVIDGLKDVDYVFLDKCTCREDTIRLLDYLKPNFFVLVQDYSKPLDKKRLDAYSSKEWKIIKIPEKNKDKFSTTQIVNRILKKYK